MNKMKHITIVVVSLILMVLAANASENSSTIESQTKNENSEFNDTTENPSTESLENISAETWLDSTTVSFNESVSLEYTKETPDTTPFSTISDAKIHNVLKNDSSSHEKKSTSMDNEAIGLTASTLEIDSEASAITTVSPVIVENDEKRRMNSFGNDKLITSENPLIIDEDISSHEATVTNSHTDSTDDPIDNSTELIVEPVLNNIDLASNTNVNDTVIATMNNTTDNGTVHEILEQSTLSNMPENMQNEETIDKNVDKLADLAIPTESAETIDTDEQKEAASVEKRSNSKEINDIINMPSTNVTEEEKSRTINMNMDVSSTPSVDVTEKVVNEKLNDTHVNVPTTQSLDVIIETEDDEPTTIHENVPSARSLDITKEVEDEKLTDTDEDIPSTRSSDVSKETEEDEPINAHENVPSTRSLNATEEAEDDKPTGTHEDVPSARSLDATIEAEEDEPTGIHDMPSARSLDATIEAEEDEPTDIHDDVPSTQSLDSSEEVEDDELTGTHKYVPSVRGLNVTEDDAINVTYVAGSFMTNATVTEITENHEPTSTYIDVPSTHNAAENSELAVIINVSTTSNPTMIEMAESTESTGPHINVSSEASANITEETVNNETASAVTEISMSSTDAENSEDNETTEKLNALTPIPVTTKPVTNDVTSEKTVVTDTANNSGVTSAWFSKNFNYLVHKDAYVSCILASMSITLKVPYSTTDKKIITKEIQVPTAVAVNGSCGDKQTHMTLAWVESFLSHEENSITFQITKDTEDFYVNSVHARVFLDDKNFPNAMETVVAGNSTKNLKLFSAPVKTGIHVCDAVTEVQCGKISVMIKDVSLVAYNDEQDLSYRKEENCVATASIGNTTLIVNIAGVAIIAGIVIIYGCFRSKKNNFRSELP